MENIIQDYINSKFNTKRRCSICNKEYNIRNSKRIINKYRITMLASPCCANIYNNQEG